MSTHRHWFAVLIASALISSTVIARNASTEWMLKVDSKLMAKASAGGEVEFFVVMKQQADVSDAYHFKTKEEKGTYVFNKLQDLAAHTQPPLWNKLQELNAPYSSYFIINGIWVKGDVSVIQALAEFSEVSRIFTNARFEMLKPVNEAQPASTGTESMEAIEWSLTLTKADQVWDLGHTGQGAVVGGQDTGYEWDHPAILAQYRGWNGNAANHNYNWHDAVHTGNGGDCGLNSTEPCDDHNHGTHTMGTMVGDDGNTNQIGMAPGATWIGCRNMDVGAGTFASYAECFQWFIAPTDLNDANPMPSKAPHVINNSWGCPPSEGCDSSNFSAMATIIGNVRAAGIVVVASAGNSGSACNTVQDPPAMFDESFSVGSTTNLDEISGFSSRGNVTVDGSNLMKPDISAPGSSIRSCIRGGSYSTFSGTSMAGPHVAGLVALIISANPALAGQVDSIENIIKSTAVQLTTTENCGGVSGSQIPNNTFGWGRIDALAAVNKVITDVHQTEGNETTRAHIYPNPMVDHATLFIQGNNQTIREVNIFTLNGQKIRTLLPQPGAIIPLNGLELASGTYFVEAVAENGVVFHEKLIVR
ncbi:MAG: S8 family serine peptidase [Flavobacteriales bacterium]|nr:S8 family serine peptidase [Flavobacteriales bacterium]